MMSYKFILPYVIGAFTLIPNKVQSESYQPDSDNISKTKIATVADFANVATPDSIPMLSTNKPIQIEQSGRSVIYIFSDGRRVIRANGTRAWRNNNPGNLRYYDFAKNHGAIGEAGKYAVFPDEETGMQALYKLLQTKSYKDLTIEAALKRFDPVTWETYIVKLTRLTGLSANTKLRDLTADQLNKMAKTIHQLEGWVPGKETQIQAPQYTARVANQQKIR